MGKHSDDSDGAKPEVDPTTVVRPTGQPGRHARRDDEEQDTDADGK